jgi:hypothetical protein
MNARLDTAVDVQELTFTLSNVLGAEIPVDQPARQQVSDLISLYVTALEPFAERVKNASSWRPLWTQVRLVLAVSKQLIYIVSYEPRITIEGIDLADAILKPAIESSRLLYLELLTVLTGHLLDFIQHDASL